RPWPRQRDHRAEPRRPGPTPSLGRRNSPERSAGAATPQAPAGTPAQDAAGAPAPTPGSRPAAAPATRVSPTPESPSTRLGATPRPRPSPPSVVDVDARRHGAATMA